MRTSLVGSGMVKWVVWAPVKEKTVIIVCVPGSAWGGLESL